jgi:hypothetical protein
MSASVRISSLRAASKQEGIVGFMMLGSKSAPSQMTLHDSNVLRLQAASNIVHFLHHLHVMKPRLFMFSALIPT